MEPAGFRFQAFFESLDIKKSLGEPFSILFRRSSRRSRMCRVWRPSWIFQWGSGCA
jgi:hypothetical protein